MPDGGPGQGDDTILTSLATFTLKANFERLEAEGGRGLFGTGNTVANRLSGGAGRDHFLGLEGNDDLDGGAGIDTLEGGVGDDTYYAELRDVVIEAAGAGTD